MRQSKTLPRSSVPLIPWVFAGCCKPLLGVGPSRHYLRNPCMVAWAPYPVASLRCICPFLPGEHRPHLSGQRFGSLNSPCNATSTGPLFSGLQPFLYVQAPMLARPPGCTYRCNRLDYMAARPFTPRIEHVVTQHELWYRYMPESGNWHDGTFTRWIAALSAAPAAFNNSQLQKHEGNVKGI